MFEARSSRGGNSSRNLLRLWALRVMGINGGNNIEVCVPGLDRGVRVLGRAGRGKSELDVRTT